VKTLSKTQCAAVITCSSSRIEPPQNWPAYALAPLLMSAAWNGTSEMSDTWLPP
jgi:hypothetical protein